MLGAKLAMPIRHIGNNETPFIFALLSLDITLNYENLDFCIIAYGAYCGTLRQLFDSILLTEIIKTKNNVK